MSEPGGDPSSGISSGDALILPERHPACRRREARPGFRTFQAFAKEFGRLTFREAHAMWFKQVFWNIRVGHSSFTDEVDQ
jgi:hypothetical protein